MAALIEISEQDDHRSFLNKSLEQYARVDTASVV